MARGRGQIRAPARTRDPRQILRTAADPAVALDRLVGGDREGDLFDHLRASDELRAVLPEVARCDGFDQRSPWHPEGDLYVHLSSVYRRICRLSDDVDLRWAAILHDIGKPASFWQDADGVGHFYASAAHGTEDHEVVGARMAEALTARLRLAPDRRARITLLVRWHMSRPTTLRGLRRLHGRVGGRALMDLLLFRLADHEGADDPAPYVARMHALALAHGLHWEHER